MLNEDLEFRISQYADGTLATHQRAELESLLQADPDAQQLLAEYQKLHGQTEQSFSLPTLNWDQLAKHISSTITQADQPVIAGRIGYWRQRLAIAASIAIVAMAGLLLYRSHRISRQTLLANAQIVVIGPQAEPADGPALQQISIGPSRALASTGQSWRYAQGIVSQPSRAVILTELNPNAPGSVHLH